MQWFDQFFGMGSKLRKQQLAGEQQTMDIAHQQELRAEDLHTPNLASAKAVAGVQQNELDKSNTDTATRNGSMTALDQAPLSLWRPTTDLNDEELGQWRNLHAQNGVKDFSSAATAWNKAMAMRGRLAKPEGAIPTQYTTGPDGTMSVSGAVLPDLSKIPGLTPSAPLPAPAIPPGPDAAPAPRVTNPATPSAAAPTSPFELPSFQNLLPMMMNPFMRPAIESAVSMQNTLATNKEKNQQIEKNERDIAYGTPEERKSESEFIRNAAQLSHRLNELQDTVSKYGNYEYWNPEGASKLSSLPLDISDNWTKITNPGGVLREGLVHLGKTLQIPLPEHLWTSGAVKNDTTLAAITQTKKVLADYVRQYENMATTKQPVVGLTPEVRKLVGETRFGTPDKIPAESGADASTALASRIFTSTAEAVKGVPEGQPYVLIDPQSGKAVKWTRGKEPWATNQLPAVSTAPPIQMPR